MTHKELCEIGSKFLKRPESANGHGCHFALIEPSCYGENPDVIGFRHGVTGVKEYQIDNVVKTYEYGWDVGSVVLEAKTSRSDFLADRKKPHRINPETGMGKWRYYICPNNLIKIEELPDKWGLIYVSDSGRCKIMAGAMAVPKIKHHPNRASYRNGKLLMESFKKYAFNERNIQNEFNILCMALNRLQDSEQILYMQREFARMKDKI